MGRFVAGDGMDDAQGFESGEVLVLRELVGELDVARVADLGDHDDSADFFDLVVVGWGGAVEVAGDLDAKVGDGDEAFEDVLRHDVRVVTVFADVVRGNVDVV